jgi:hypothetical protein
MACSVLTEKGKTMLFYEGYMIVTSKYCCDIVQARRHKKKRINKKWRKRYGMKQVPSKKMFVCGDRIYVHETVYDRLKERIKRRLADGKK